MGIVSIETVRNASSVEEIIMELKNSQYLAQLETCVERQDKHPGEPNSLVHTANLVWKCKNTSEKVNIDTLIKYAIIHDLGKFPAKDTEENKTRGIKFFELGIVPEPGGSYIGHDKLGDEVLTAFIVEQGDTSYDFKELSAVMHHHMTVHNAKTAKSIGKMIKKIIATPIEIDEFRVLCELDFAEPESLWWLNKGIVTELLPVIIMGSGDVFANEFKKLMATREASQSPA